MTAMLFGAACAAQSTQKRLDSAYGKEQVRERQLAATPASGVDYWTQVKPILDSRCVVCHGCYDSPCQLKLTAIEGVTRGASKALVYEPSRLLAAQLTRLFEDADSTEEWRTKGFHPVLNERENIAEANREGSVLFKMLELKKAHPLPETRRLKNFDFALDREQTCPTIAEFPKYEKQHPQWGMPYGLPGLSDAELATITRWLEEGAVYAARDSALPAPLSDAIADWEELLNGASKKQQLSARYIFEHLFLGHFYFSDVQGEQPTQFFELVRSKTPPGEAVQAIATRRPFDDPQVERVYYRFIPLRTTVLLKTHMPYALNAQRKQNWNTWFFDAAFEVESLPGYQAATSANPFATYLQIPVRSRYRFMIDEARFTIDGFIKGPVCRGQTSLNVINDRFWITFLDPESIDQQEASFYAKEASKLTLPAAEQSNALLLTNWIRYSEKEKDYLKAKRAMVNQKYGARQQSVTLDLIWDGDGENKNAALTVFRHEDSATVQTGLLGAPPKTSWVIGYGLLERIHYLLVAGFDVFGNVGHQLNTRIYMDFLRMEAEANFLGFLPKWSRDALRDSWYVGAEGAAQKYIRGKKEQFTGDPAISYTSHNPALELYEYLRARLAPVNDPRWVIDERSEPELRQAWQRLEAEVGGPVMLFPQVSWVRVVDAAGSASYLTLLRDNEHKNIMSIFSEDSNRVPEKDRFTVLRGALGAYPNALFEVRREELADFVVEVLSQKDEKTYDVLRDRFGVRRTSSRFWSYSDTLHEEIARDLGLEAGGVDYNRLENR